MRTNGAPSTGLQGQVKHPPIDDAAFTYKAPSRIPSPIGQGTRGSGLVDEGPPATPPFVTGDEFRAAPRSIR